MMHRAGAVIYDEGLHVQKILGCSLEMFCTSLVPQKLPTWLKQVASVSRMSGQWQSFKKPGQLLAQSVKYPLETFRVPAFLGSQNTPCFSGKGWAHIVFQSPTGVLEELRCPASLGCSCSCSFCSTLLHFIQISVIQWRGEREENHFGSKILGNF